MPATERFTLWPFGVVTKTMFKCWNNSASFFDTLLYDINTPILAETKGAHLKGSLAS
jgi:hypothetical protein